AYAGIGKIHWKKKDFISAEKYLLVAASYDDKNFDILFMLGRAMLKNQNYEKANEFLYLAKELKPTQANVYFYRGIAQAHLGDPMGTAAQFNMYLTYEPDNITAHYNRGFAFLKLGMTDWAVEDFEKVLEINPGHIEALA